MNEKSSGKSALSYRPDIDGLRAVAVMAVLVFHSNLSSKTDGGFVGVDVFFVISGYLISSIVFSEIANSRFSVIGFYERRIRRIFPALFGMLAVFSIFASIYLLPTDLVNFAKSLLAATISTSNFYFWRHSGYFDSPLSYPLLHTWSLAVEEQFYIFFPLFLVVVRRFLPQHLKAAVVVLFFVSLATSVAIVPYSSETAFYMPYTRAWELLLGTILSLGMFPRLHSVWLRNAVTLSGMALIAFSIHFYSVSTPFPGLSALVPCIGAAAIIGAGESGPSLVGRLLSWRPVVFIGLISYSLYLWHWPFIILQRMGVLLTISTTLPGHYDGLISQVRYNALTEIVVPILLAILSWRFVERPFRSGSLRLSGRPLFALAGGVMVVFIAFSSWTILAGGFAGRFSPQAAQVASYLGNNQSEEAMRVGTCFIANDAARAEFDKSLCLHHVNGKSNYLLLGDSHSALLWNPLSAVFPNVNIMQATASSCKPFPHPVGSSDCQEIMNYVFQSYLPAHPVDGLLLEARWLPRDVGGITDVVNWATQHRIPVFLFGPIQDYDAPLPRLLAYSISWNQPALPMQHRMSLDGPIDAQLESLAANTWHVPYISLYKAICTEGVCTEYADADRKVPLMFDADHLSPPGSHLIVSRLAEKGELRLP